jgi:hypothetical protein
LIAGGQLTTHSIKLQAARTAILFTQYFVIHLLLILQGLTPSTKKRGLLPFPHTCHTVCETHPQQLRENRFKPTNWKESLLENSNDNVFRNLIVKTAIFVFRNLKSAIQLTIWSYLFRTLKDYMSRLFMWFLSFKSSHKINPVCISLLPHECHIIYKPCFLT